MGSFAVVLRLTPAGLYAARELGSQGVPVLGVDYAPMAGFYSRHLTFGPRRLLGSSDSDILDCLMRVGSKGGTKGILIPTSDAFVELVSTHHLTLGEKYLFQNSYDPGYYKNLIDKESFYKACDQHGIAYPAFVRLDRSSMENAPAELRFPCILKPTLIHQVRQHMAGRKVIYVKDLDSYRRAVDSIPNSPSDWLVQEVVEGPESNIALYGAYFDADSKPHQAFTATKVRQYPPGFGSASLVRSSPQGEVGELTEFLLSRMNYTGIAGSEFKWDERDKQYKIIEINPRPTLWFGLTHHCGKRIVAAAFSNLSGEEMPEELPQRNDVVWKYAGKDFVSNLKYWRRARDITLKKPEVSKNLREVKRTVYPVASMNDPKPLYGEFRNYLVKIANRLFQK